MGSRLCRCVIKVFGLLACSDACCVRGRPSIMHQVASGKTPPMSPLNEKISGLGHPARPLTLTPQPPTRIQECKPCGRAVPLTHYRTKALQ